jgi:sec-independent protein translocase protein TatA
MPNIGLPEIIIVLVIVLLIFGVKRVPELGQSLGTGLRNFKDAVTGRGDDDDRPDRAELGPASSPARAERPAEAGAPEDAGVPAGRRRSSSDETARDAVP